MRSGWKTPRRPRPRRRRRCATCCASRPRNRQRLGLVFNELGIMLFEGPRPATAEEPYAHALAIREKLATDFPQNLSYRLDVGGSYCNMGHLLAIAGQAPAEALPFYGKS